MSHNEMTCCEPAHATCPTDVITPQVKITEKDDRVVLIAELPGVDGSLVDVVLENDTLTIRALKLALEFEGYELVQSQFGEGEYFREFQLNGYFERSSVEASVKDGILTVVLPKAKEELSHRVKVNAG